MINNNLLRLLLEKHIKSPTEEKDPFIAEIYVFNKLIKETVSVISNLLFFFLKTHSTSVCLL